MKILFGIGDMNPNHLRGTELYVLWLSKSLIALGHEVQVIAPSSERFYEQHTIDGITIRRFGFKKRTFSKNELLFAEAHKNMEEFETAIEEFNPDIFHLNSINILLGPYHLKKCKEKGIATIFTTHVPHFICPIGIYVRNKKQCTKRISKYCLKCILKTRKIGWISPIMISLYPLIRNIDAIPGLLKIPAQKKKIIDLIRTNSDKIVSSGDWLTKSLINNGVSASRVVLIRQGINPSLEVKLFKEQDYYCNCNVVNTKTKIGYLGAFHEIKGVEFLLNTFRRFLKKYNHIELELVGDYQSKFGNYLYSEYSQINGITFLGKKYGGELTQWLAGLDWIVVPSQCAETGPMVVMEALFMGIPVIGSNLGGIRELVIDGENGFLFDPFEKNGLMDILKYIDEEKLNSIKNKLVPFNRNFKDVGKDMQLVYESIM